MDEVEAGKGEADSCDDGLQQLAEDHGQNTTQRVSSSRRQTKQALALAAKRSTRCLSEGVRNSLSIHLLHDDSEGIKRCIQAQEGP